MAKGGIEAADAKATAPIAGDVIAACGFRCWRLLSATPPSSSKGGRGGGGSSSSPLFFYLFFLQGGQARRARPARPRALQVEGHGPALRRIRLLLLRRRREEAARAGVPGGEQGRGGAGIRPGRRDEPLPSRERGSWAAAAAPLPAPAMTATADAVVANAEGGEPELKTIDTSRAVDYFLNGVAVSPQSGLIFVVFFPFATTDAAVERAKRRRRWCTRRRRRERTPGGCSSGRPLEGGRRKTASSAPAPPLPLPSPSGWGGRGPGGAPPWPPTGTRCSWLTPPAAAGSNGTLTVSRATVKKTGARKQLLLRKTLLLLLPLLLPLRLVLTTTAWTRVGSKPLEAKTSPGSAFVGCQRRATSSRASRTGTRSPGSRSSAGPRRSETKDSTTASGSAPAAGTTATGRSRTRATRSTTRPSWSPADGSAFLGTSPGTATNAVAAAAAALLTSSGFDELDKLGKLPNKVYVCRPGARSLERGLQRRHRGDGRGRRGQAEPDGAGAGAEGRDLRRLRGPGGPLCFQDSGGGGKDGSSKPATVGGQGLGGRVLGRPVGLVVDGNGVPTIALTNSGFGNTTGDSEDFREIVVKTCKGC